MTKRTRRKIDAAPSRVRFAKGPIDIAAKHYQDRSSRPYRARQPTLQAAVEKIERLRRQRWTGKQIAAKAGISPATVSRVQRRLGLHNLSALEPGPVYRYECENPGELIHRRVAGLISIS